MLKYALFALVLYVYQVSCLDPACKDNSPNKLFADPKNPHNYHQCSYGRDMGTITCKGDEIFDENQQTCIISLHPEPLCKDKTDGQYDYPGNPFKFLTCYQGHAFVLACPDGLVWSESIKMCKFNVDGLTSAKP